MKAQKPTAKQASAKESLQGAFAELVEPWKNKLVNLAKDWEKFKDILKNNYELGQAHLQRGNVDDAILRFRFVIWLQPGYKDSWYFLGCSYLANGDKTKAKSCLLKSLKQDPQNIRARYILALVMGKDMPKGELPQTLPTGLLVEQFDEMAATFDAQQLGEMEYEGHILLCNAVKDALTTGKTDHIVLDLGCGTGLCGPLMDDVSAHITGVDFSGGMLGEARKLLDENGKPVYNALQERNVIEFITDGPEESYDVILASALLSYISEIEIFFEHTARMLKPGGLLAVTAEYLESGSVAFDPEIGQFRHSLAYLTDLATRYGLEEFRCREGEIYPKIAGLLCVFRKA